jgi:hypothetical protein
MKLHIERLELELHGDIAADTAHDAVRLLGPALAEALRNAGPGGHRVDAGTTLQVGARPDAATLAGLMARQLAPQLAAALAPPADSTRET